MCRSHLKACLLFLALLHRGDAFRGGGGGFTLPPRPTLPGDMTPPDPSQVFGDLMTAAQQQQLLQCCDNAGTNPMCAMLDSPLSAADQANKMCANVGGGAASVATRQFCLAVLFPVSRLKRYCSAEPFDGICSQCHGNHSVKECMCQCRSALGDSSAATLESCTGVDGPACSVGFIPKSDTGCWCSTLLAPNATRSKCDCDQYGECDLKPGVCIDQTEKFTPEQRLEACIDDPEVDYDKDELQTESLLSGILAFICLPGLVFVLVIVLTRRNIVNQGVGMKYELAFRSQFGSSKSTLRPDETDRLNKSSTIRNIAKRMKRPSLVLADENRNDTVSKTFSLEVHNLSFYVLSNAKQTSSKGLVNKFISKFDFSKPKEYKQLIHNVSSQFKPGTLTAIMGPSGAGKTTLLNLLSGRASSGEYDGTCMLNGQPLPRSVYNSIMSSQGYVLQQDCFLEWLTVKQWMIYEALLRLPDSKAYQDKVHLALVALSEVDLMNSLDTRIGGTTFKGISGGQKRRLSIAVELLRMPAVLLCDEPTSGLDATSSLKVVHLLKKLAQQGSGRTVVTTIHQPRAEIIALFDNVLLLGTGGHVIYLGPVPKAVNHLQMLVRQSTEKRGGNGDAIDFSKYDNPADFLIDVVGLDPEAESQIGIDQQELVDAWATSFEKRELLASISRTHEEAELHPQIRIPKQTQAGTFNQIRALLARRLAGMYGSPSAYLPNFFTLICVSIVVGIAFSYDDYDPKTRAYEVTMFLFCICSYAMILQYLILPPVYYEERAVLRAARASRACSIVSYIVGSSFEECASAFAQCTLLMIAGQFESDLNPEAGFMFFRFSLLLNGVLAFQGLICWVTTLTDSLATAYNIIFLILAIGSLFGGIFVQYQHVPGYFLWAYYTSIPMLTFRAMVVNDLKCCHLSCDCVCFNTYIANLEADTSTGVTSQHPVGLDDLNYTAYEENPYYCFENADRSQPYSGEGNLGRYYLENLDFEQITKYETLWILIASAIFFRVIAIMTFLFKEWRSHRLVERKCDTQYLTRKTTRWTRGSTHSTRSITLPPARAPSMDTPTINAAATTVFGVSTSFSEDDDTYEDEDPITPTEPFVSNNLKPIELRSLLPGP